MKTLRTVAEVRQHLAPIRRDAVIGLSQLEEALKAQILYGGRLGTNLVELSLLDLDTLGRSTDWLIDRLRVMPT